MKKNKGFTMIELIGVLIIMGLLLLIVFPATIRLMKNNEKAKYDYYHDIILKAANVYATDRRDDLGGIEGNGCIDDITLSLLIEKDYVKEFDEEGIVCGTPSEFTEENGRVPLDQLGFSDNYIDVKIVNKKGKISAEASLICVKGRKVVYSKLVEKSGACNKYVAEAENTLFSAVSGLATIAGDGSNYFVNGSVTNNYVWYSGKLWRVVSVNKNDKTIKLVTDNLISTLSYDVNNSNFVDSNINIWLNNNFLDTLKNPATYLLDATWNYTTVADASIPANTNTTNTKVGLLNYYEYSKVGGFLNISQNWWLLSKASEENAWYVSNGNAVANMKVNDKFIGVRPSVVLRSNITYVSGGTGTKTNPYKLSGDNSANVGTLLNTRYAGEYVRFDDGDGDATDDVVYRIVKATPEYTRLISTVNFSSSRFHYHESNYNMESSIGIFLNDSWYSDNNIVPASAKALLMVSDYCIDTVLPDKFQTDECPLEKRTNVKVGIPKMNDLFTASIPSGEFWTLSPTDEKHVNVILTDGSVVAREIEENSGIRPVISVVPTAEIVGGNGTLSAPYIIG